MPSGRSGRAAPLPPDERRLAILRAVLPVVRARGTDVTTRELAEAAQVAEGTLFRVFDDKDSLVREAIAAAHDSAEFGAALAAIDVDLPIEQRVAAAVQAGVARMGDFALWMSTFHRHPRDGDRPRRGGAHAGPHEGWAQRREATQVLVRAQLRRLLEPDADRIRFPIDSAILLLEAMLMGTVVQSAGRFRLGLSTTEATPDLVVDFFLHGVLHPVPVTP